MVTPVGITLDTTEEASSEASSESESARWRILQQEQTHKKILKRKSRNEDMEKMNQSSEDDYAAAEIKRQMDLIKSLREKIMKNKGIRR